MRDPHRTAVLLRRCRLLAAVLLLPACSDEGSRVEEASPAVAFPVEEATIASIHAAFAAGSLTCEELVLRHLDRIDAYDKSGPELNAILTVHPRAVELARELDEEYRRAPASSRPLHCIPVIVKDNFDTHDLPTTGGSVALRNSYPSRDAFVVRRLRDAGALVLAKSNLTELARGGTTVSSLGGQTRNPYDLGRTPGGSSGGTGAAIAASFGVLGTGSDTGQSIRSPASAQSLVGVRPTRGLISRQGIIPLSSTQDEAGPITRTVDDAARMLEVIVGYDPDDPVTAFSLDKVPAEGYVAHLREDGLVGARIGLLHEMLGGDPKLHSEVNAVVDQVVERMTGLGAEVVKISIPELPQLTSDLGLSGFESRAALDAYFASLGPSAPVHSMREFVAAGGHHPSIAAGLRSNLDATTGLDSPEYKDRLLRRETLRSALMNAMAREDLDAILYPHQMRLVVPIGEEQLERNGVLSNGTGFPAVTFPGGYSAPTDAAPLGVPIGVELLGPEWSEPELLMYAYAFQQATMLRRAPLSTPPRSSP